MAKFKKNPIVIEAVQYKGYPVSTELKNFLKSGNSNYYGSNNRLYLETLEGDLKVSVNDWIIKGITKELYPCKPDIFEATYELIES